jgi:glycosyltransferase involved in cell wall biosynthesis
MQEEKIIDGVNFISLPAAQPRDILKMIPRLHQELRIRKPDILIASGDIYIGGLTAMLSRGRPWLFDLYDDYRYFASASIPGMKTLFRRLLKNADQVIVASKPLAARYGNDAREISIIENGIDPSLFRPLPKDQCRGTLRIPSDETVIGYFGSITQQRGINTLLQAFEEIRRALPSTRLLLAGRSSSDIQLIDPGVDYRGFVSQKEVPTLISACDVVVIPYTRDPLIDATNACKISEYLACGVPVVTTRISNMAEIFPNTPQILAEPGNATSLSAAITFQLNNRIIFPLSHSWTWSELAKNVEATLSGLLERNASPKHHHN